MVRILDNLDASGRRFGCPPAMMKMRGTAQEVDGTYDIDSNKGYVYAGGYSFDIGDVEVIGLDSLLEIAKRKSAEAAQEIKELEKKIEDAKPKITMDEIVPGAQFLYVGGYGNPRKETSTLILNHYDDLWYIAGAHGSIFQIYHSRGRTKDEMLEYLVNDHEFVKNVEWTK